MPSTNPLAVAWSEGRSTVGVWLASEGRASAEVLARAGFDYVVIDLQHGLLSTSGALEVMRALAGTESVVLCRAPSNDAAAIGRLLDHGAGGVIVPMVNDADDARRAVAACRYAPRGSRSWGPTRARLVAEPSAFATPAAADASVLCIPMIETVEAVANLDEIVAVDGIDALYVGPSDLGITMRLAPAVDHPDERFVAALTAVRERCAERGIGAGVHADPDHARRRLDEGFSMVTVTSDLDALRRGAAAALDALARPLDAPPPTSAD